MILTWPFIFSFFFRINIYIASIVLFFSFQSVSVRSKEVLIENIQLDHVSLSILATANPLGDVFGSFTVDVTIDMSIIFSSVFFPLFGYVNIC